MKKPAILLLVAAILATSYFFIHRHFIAKESSREELYGEREEEEREREEEEGGEGRQTGAEKQMMSWMWSRGYPDPTNLNAKFWAAWQEYKEIKANTNAILNNGTANRLTGYGNWSSLGTVNNIGGRIVCMTIDPNTPNNNLFIGSASGGIWKTTNGGSSWSYVNTGFPVLGIGDITYHPTNSSILLAGTGEVYRVDGSDRGNIGFNVWKARGTYGVGILRTTDGGANWTQVMNKNTSDLFAIQEIAYDPNNADIVYACATDGLYRSTDGGVTWPTTPLYSKIYVRDIAINPSNSNEIVISVGNLVNTDKGLYRTTNGGTSWTKISAIVTTFSGYIKLDNNGTRLYASVGRGSGDELYMSNDFGATWSLKTGSNHCGGQYWFAHEVEVDPANANRVIMGGVNYYTYTSSNATTGGTRATTGSGVHADVHDIEFHPSNSNIIYIANDGGMYKSTNGGSTYSAINNGLIAVQFYANFATSPTSANVMIGGLQDNGVVKYNGTSWSSLVGGDGGPSMFHPKNGNKVIYSNDARAVYYSANAGTSETQRLLNLGYGYAQAYDDRTGFMSPVGMSYPTDATNPIVMYVGSDNLHISIDSGGSFQRPDPADMTRYIDAQYKPAIALGVSQSNRNKVYVSTSPLSQRADDGLNYNPPAKVMRSLNASSNTGYTFSNISTALPDRMTTDFAISKFSDDSVYITMGGFGSGHVYLTPDGGTTWLNRSTGLPNVPFNAILIDPIRPSVIYAACDFGVYVSHNKGVNWFDFNEGFWETTMVMDLQVTADNKIVAATHGKGAFRSDLFIPPTTLPVTISSFTGVNNGNVNNLKWTTHDELNLSRYELERSTDGNAFQKVATIAARNVASVNNYIYNDNIANQLSPVFYYRLKSVDIDGTYYYSDVVVIQINKREGFKLLGNPVYNTLTFQYSAMAAGKMTIQLKDMQGKLIRKQEQAVAAGVGTYSSSSDLTGLPAGVYVLEIWINQRRYVEKVVKR